MGYLQGDGYHKDGIRATPEFSLKALEKIHFQAHSCSQNSAPSGFTKEVPVSWLAVSLRLPSDLSCPLLAL